MVARVIVDKARIPILRVRVAPATLTLREWRHMGIRQQNQALCLVAHHAKTVEFMPTADYARCILHWQINSAGEVVGWISGRSNTAKEQ